MLVIFHAVQRFRHHIEDRPFTILTNHKPLIYAFTIETERSPRQTRHLTFISKFSTDIQHIDGKKNVVADTLSRLSTTGLPAIDYQQLSKDQAQSEEITGLRNSTTGLQLVDVPFSNFTVLCDTSTGKERPVLPSEWTKRAFEVVHNLSHPGIKPTQQAVTARFVWHGLKREVQRWCKECHAACQSSKI